MAADRAATGFSATWIDELIAAVAPVPDPAVRSGHVALSRPAWHQVSVLKFVNSYFILERPDLAMLQRGQEQTVEQLVVAFDSWLADRDDAARAPRRLVDLIAAATRGYARIARDQPELLDGRTSGADLARMGRGRGIIDYVSSLTDAQAVAYAARLSGASGLLWTTGGL
jgi:dGTPase